MGVGFTAARLAVLAGAVLQGQLASGPASRVQPHDLALALTVVRTTDPVATWLTRYENTWLVPEHRPDCGGWLVSVYLADTRVGYVWVIDGRIAESEGPWTKPADIREGPPDDWTIFRSSLFFKHGAYALALIFLALLLDLGRPWTLRNLDVLVLAAFVPANMAVRTIPMFGRGMLLVGTVYLMARLVWRGLHPPGTGTNFGLCEIGAPSGFFRLTLVPILVIAGALAWQVVTLDAPAPGEGYGKAVLGFAAHLVGMAALVGLGKKVSGTFLRNGPAGAAQEKYLTPFPGWVLAAAYISLSVAQRQFFVAEAVLPAVGIAAALCAWPRRPSRERYFTVISLAAAIVAGVELCLTPWFGEHVGWYLPLALAGLFGAPAPQPPQASGADQERPA